MVYLWQRNTSDLAAQDIKFSILKEKIKHVL